MKDIYMEMPTLAGIRMPGIIAAGVNIPQDDHNDDWRAFQAFQTAGGEARPFDSTLTWDGKAYVQDAELVKQNLANAREAALKRVDAFHAEIVQRLVGNPTQVEKDTWTLKLDTAGAIMAKTPLTAAGEQFLAGAALADVMAKEAWARSVLANATSYAKVVGLAERLRDDARTAIRAAKGEAEIAEILAAQREAADAAVASLQR